MPLSTHRVTHLLQALSFLLLVAASVVALWPVQRNITARLDKLKHEIVLRMEQATGRRITYQSISPSIFRFLEIRGLKVFDQGNATTPLLQVHRIEVSYSIWQLLMGNPVAAVNEISIENSSLHVNTQHDADLIRFFNDLRSGRSATSTVPSFGGITLAGKNLTLSVTSPQGNFTIDRVFFQIQSAGQAIQVRVRGGVSVAFKEGPLGLQNVATALQVSGTVGRQLDWSDLRVRFDNLSSNLLKLSRPTFHVTLRDGVWQLRKIQDNAPIDVRASYDQHNGQFKSSFVADGFRPEDYFTFGRRLTRYAPWLTSILSGSGSFDYSFASKALSYRASVHVALSNHLLPFPLDVRADVAGSERFADFSRLAMKSKYGNLQFVGNLDLSNFLPNGTLDASNVYTPLGSRLAANFKIERHASTVEARSPELVLGKSILHRVAISVSPAPQNVNFTLGASFDDQRTQFKGDGTLYLSPNPYVLLSLSTDGLPLDQLYALVDRQPLPTVFDTLKGLQMTSKMFITSNLKQFSFASPKVVISDGRKKTGRHISLEISGTNRSLDLKRMVVDWRNYHVAGSFTAQYVEQNRLELSSTATVESTSYSVHGFYQLNDSLILSGNHGIDLAAVRQAGQYVFTLKTNDLPIPIRDTEMHANLDLEGIYSDPQHWEVVSRNTKITNLPLFQAKSNSLTISARISSRGGDIYSLDYTDPISHLAGNGKVSLNPAARGFAGSGWVQLTGSLPGESYSANFAFSPGQIDASVNFANSPLVRLGKLPVSGRVSGEVGIKGKLTNPDLSVNLSLPNGQINTDPLTASLAVSMTGSQIQLKELTARYLASSLRQASGHLDFRTGSFSFAGDYRGDVNGDPVSAHVVIGGEATPVQRRNELSKMLAGSFSALARVTSITVQNKPAKPWDVRISKNADRVVIDGGPDAGVSGYVLQSGAFSVRLASPLPITLQADGKISGSTIHASLQNVVLDLHAFDTVAKIPYFDISKGKARGKLEITGAVNDPDIQGELTATDVFGKTPVVPNEIGPFNTNLVFRGKSLAMSDVVIHSGNSRVLGNLNFTIEHWIPASYDLKFTTQGTQGVHVKYSISGIDFDGYATGTASIKGDSTGTQIGGNLDINSCLITIGNETGGAPPGGGSSSSSDVNYDFTFTTGRQVQFVWPNNTVPILRSFADTGQKLKITANGGTGNFSIVGNINVKGGEVFYLRQNFYLREGSITFNADQNRVDPIVNARAELREVDAEGKNVTIYLVVNHKPLSQFAPSFESDPPMPNSQILALLGQDIYTQLGGPQHDLASSMFFTGIDLLSQFSILRSFEDKVKQAFNLDLFSVRTDLLQNVVREKLLGQAPPPSSTPSSSLGRYLDNTTFFLGKYFGNDLFLEAMINLRSNNAFLAQFGNTGNLQVDSQILFEWKTPLFLLQLSFLPDPTDFLSSLTKTSLSLSWGFSF